MNSVSWCAHYHLPNLVAASKNPITPVMKEFIEKLSYKAIFEDYPATITSWMVNSPTERSIEVIETVDRTFNTDGEPDDVLDFLHFLPIMNDQYKKTGKMPTLEVAVSEGDANLLAKKAKTFRTFYFIWLTKIFSTHQF